MKSKAQITRVVQILALLLAVLMLLAACGRTPDEAGVDSSDTNSSTESSDVASGDDVADPSNTDNTGSKTTSGASSKTNSGGGTGSNNQGGGSDKAVFSKDPYSDISAAAKKNPVHVLMWRKYTPSEQALVNGFTKKTGIQVKTTVTTENEYLTKLIALVSGKNSPDVVLIQSELFPGAVTKAMQKLDRQTFRLDDPIWYKTYMDQYKVNGNYYSVAINGIWSCEDCNYVTYYNTKVLKDCGVTTTPYQLYQQGKWNWEAQKKIAEQVYVKNKSYTGIAMQSYDLMMLSAGADFVTYNKNNQFTNNLGSVKSNSMLVKAWTEVSKLQEAKLLGPWLKDAFVAGKVGLFTAISYGLYNEGDWWQGGSVANVEAVPVAGPTQNEAYTPVRPKTWGVAKGAKNPEGAAFFLRYYLDPSNLNMSSTFYNKQFENVYKLIIDKKAKKAVRVSVGVVDYITAGTYNSLLSKLTNTTAANITTVLNSQKSVVDKGVQRANADLKKVK